MGRRLLNKFLPSTSLAILLISSILFSAPLSAEEPLPNDKNGEKPNKEKKEASSSLAEKIFLCVNDYNGPANIGWCKYGTYYGPLYLGNLFYSNADEVYTGIQFSLVTLDDEFYGGAQFSLVSIPSNFSGGMLIALLGGPQFFQGGFVFAALWTYSRIVRGFMQIGGLAAGAIGGFHGFAQIAGLMAATENFKGFAQISFWNSTGYSFFEHASWSLEKDSFIKMDEYDFTGAFQIGVLNTASSFIGAGQIGAFNKSVIHRGTQIGVVNLANECEGMQIGLVNYAQNMRGIQIGLVNIIMSSPVPFMPIINMAFDTLPAQGTK